MTNQGIDKRFLEVEMVHEEGDIRGIADIVMQVFFRYRMGERYFSFKTLRGGLYVLLVVRFLFFFGADFTSGYPFHGLDIALILYLLLGFWQLIQHRRLASKGQSIHSYFIGYSRFFFIGKALIMVLNLIISLPFRLFQAKPFQFRPKSAYYLTYTLIEPLITLALAAMFYFYLKSPVAALLCAAAALILFWTAINKVSSARQIYVDRADGQIFTQALQSDMVKANDKQMQRQGIRTKTPQSIPVHSPLSPVREVPPVQANHNTISVSDALKNLNPNLKNLDKEDGTK